MRPEGSVARLLYRSQHPHYSPHGFRQRVAVCRSRTIGVTCPPFLSFTTVQHNSIEASQARSDRAMVSSRIHIDKHKMKLRVRCTCTLGPHCMCHCVLLDPFFSAHRDNFWKATLSHRWCSAMLMVEPSSKVWRPDLCGRLFYTDQRLFVYNHGERCSTPTPVRFVLCNTVQSVIEPKISR